MTTPYTGINISPRLFRDELLMGVSFVFDTKGNDKDHDTALDIKVYSQNGVLAAERTGVTGHWANKTSYLVSLDLKNCPTKAAMSTGSVRLEIRPNGDDHWEFKHSMWMFFSDKTAVEKHWDEKELSQKNPLTTDDWMESA